MANGIQWGGKRYHPFGTYLRGRFGRRVWKVAVDAGMTCPNRDGTLGTGGCTYCRREAHLPGGSTPPPVEEQIADGIERLRSLRKAERFIVYFQAGTNTYAPAKELRKLYDLVRLFDGVVGLAVGTRPDCLGDGVLDLLEGYTADYEVWLELGLQSAHDTTLRAINRGHDVAAFLDAYRRAQRRPLKLCVHVILGLPGEGRDRILETVRLLAALRPEGVKLHPLQVLRGTPLEKNYLSGGFEALGFEEYVGLACDALELLPPETTIQRLTAEAPPELLLAPDWCADKRAVLAAVDAELGRRDTRQGSRLEESVVDGRR